MKLFDEQDTNDYIEEKKDDIIYTIENLSDNEIMTRDLNELKNYFFNKFYIEPINILKENITSNIDKSKKEEYNPFYHMTGLGNEYNIVDSYKITYSIPFSGKISLLYLKPSISKLSKFEIDRIENTRAEYYPCIICSLNINQKTLESQENPKDFLETEFNREYSKIFEMINYVNNDISIYNNKLETFVLKQLEERKNKATKFSVLLNKLNIPLKENTSAPQLQSIPLTLKKTSLSFPKVKKVEENWQVEEKDYLNIKNIISTVCLSFEHAPSACQKLNEGELRDFLLASLNTHYDSLATGETFSKNGKTDIRIQFKNKSAYIAECKIWHGISEIKKAIKQLVSYTTWRDVKTSLIVFNKENKDFSLLIEKLDTFIKEDSLFVNYNKISKNEWQCTIKKEEDSLEKVQLHIILCDITL